MNRSSIVAVMAALIAWAAMPASAAITLQPGEWQTTETGTEDGKPAKPTVEKTCMTPEEARNATNVVAEMKKQMQDQSGAQCQKYEVRESGNSVIFEMKCAMDQQFALDMSGTFTFVSATRYSGTFKSTIKMGAMTSSGDKKVEAVRIGDCKK